MIVPTNPEERIDLVLDYLLDELPQSQIEAMDNALFESEDLASVFAEYKVDLIDAYADGRLSPTQHQRFERMLLIDLNLRALTPFAHALSSMRAHAAEAPHQRPKSQARSKLAYGAAALIAIAATLIAVIFTHRPHPVPASNPQPPTVIAANNPPRQGSIYPVILSPAILRGHADSDVHIPASADQVRLQILLPAESDKLQYTASLRGKSHSFQSTFYNLRPIQAGVERYIEVTIPSGDLQPGAYELSVSDQSGLPVHKYPLKIT
ncbi:hypothetical protein [Granulicella tundricola]|uniref:Uncharacterized protein n=1 Tax=Granulicella tundricola (strain ATCC BAA-1859 / DSM 23138 / MP5ACTX9) TaxID=1198114 RepID=E8X5Y8_GRATM|nr:hypothetical protein [Granulicella tundricola]ADW70872.1 hypothetical protein AciX9_4092 [Granulicella tundricola MP5ACTX9]